MTLVQIVYSLHSKLLGNKKLGGLHGQNGHRLYIPFIGKKFCNDKEVISTITSNYLYLIFEKEEKKLQPLHILNITMHGY